MTIAGVHRTLLMLLVVGVVGLATLACGRDPSCRTEIDALHVDAARLAQVYPAIGSPIAVHFTSRPLSDPCLIGPTDYQVSAVVRLRPETAARLAALADPGPAKTGPTEVIDAVRPHVPAGPFVQGEALDDTLGEGTGRHVQAWLIPQTGELVFNAYTS